MPRDPPALDEPGCQKQHTTKAAQTDCTSCYTTLLLFFSLVSAVGFAFFPYAPDWHEGDRAAAYRDYAYHWFHKQLQENTKEGEPLAGAFLQRPTHVVFHTMKPSELSQAYAVMKILAGIGAGAEPSSPAGVVVTFMQKNVPKPVLDELRAGGVTVLSYAGPGNGMYDMSRGAVQDHDWFLDQLMDGTFPPVDYVICDETSPLACMVAQRISVPASLWYGSDFIFTQRPRMWYLLPFNDDYLPAPDAFPNWAVTIAGWDRDEFAGLFRPFDESNNQQGQTFRQTSIGLGPNSPAAVEDELRNDFKGYTQCTQTVAFLTGGTEDPGQSTDKEKQQVKAFFDKEVATRGPGGGERTWVMFVLGSWGLFASKEALYRVLLDLMALDSKKFYVLFCVLNEPSGFFGGDEGGQRAAWSQVSFLAQWQQDHRGDAGGQRAAWSQASFLAQWQQDHRGTANERPAALFPPHNHIEVVTEYIPQMALFREGSYVAKKRMIFISHCGQASVAEALTCGVPIIGFPSTVEQAFNSLALDRAGVGINLQSLSRQVLCGQLHDQDSTWAPGGLAAAVRKWDETFPAYASNKANFEKQRQHDVLTTERVAWYVQQIASNSQNAQPWYRSSAGHVVGAAEALAKRFPPIPLRVEVLLEQDQAGGDHVHVGEETQSGGPALGEEAKLSWDKPQTPGWVARSGLYMFTWKKVFIAVGVVGLLLAMVCLVVPARFNRHARQKPGYYSQPLE